MKKSFTLLVAAACSLSMLTANATTVSVAANGNNYNITVDEITINDVPAIQQGGVNVLAINRDGVSLLVRFTDTNTLVADGTVNGSDIHYVSDGAKTYAAGFQIPSSDFENWNETTSEPVSGWHSFQTCFGSSSATARSLGGKLYCSNYTTAEKATYPNAGDHYATVESKNVVFSIANGTITTGRLKAGSTSATNTENHSEMDINKTYTDDYAKYGPFYVLLQAEPDAIKTMLKVVLKNSNSKASLSAAITDGTYYQEPKDKNYTNVAATAGSTTIANCDWTEFSYPFTYNEGVEAKAILVTISTNANPGQGSGGDQVSVDNVELVYNSNITGITATGLNDFSFNADTHNYVINYSGAPLTLTADNFTVTTNGRAAMTVKNVEDMGRGNYRITLGAYSADMLNGSVYTITVNREMDNVWALGNVNGNEWAANSGALMTYNADDDTYTLDITTTSTAWFSFTKRLATGNTYDDWDAIAPYRFGANTEGEGTNFVMRKMYLGQELELAQDGWYNAFEIPAGNYTLTIKNLDGDRKLIINGDSWPEPRLLVYGSFNNWSDYDNVIEMNLNEGAYSTSYQSIDNGDGYSYFKFIKKEAGEQDAVIGAVSNGDFLVSNEFFNTELSLTANNGQAYRIPTGEYTLTVNLDAMELIIGAEQPEYPRGDVNGDGKVDVADVNAAINIILEMKQPSDYVGNADITGDGKVDVSDVNAIINIILTQ
ncbi:MAG: hypothetical protein J5565_01180 [Muribaculaceae bacterium]|nr:hypothetical protein [Muribaculaceae bacterium]